MKGLGAVRGAFVIVTLCCFGLPQAAAIEFVGGPSPVAHMDDGMIYRTGAHHSRVKCEVLTTSFGFYGAIRRKTAFLIVLPLWGLVWAARQRCPSDPQPLAGSSWIY